MKLVAAILSFFGVVFLLLWLAAGGDAMWQFYADALLGPCMWVSQHISDWVGHWLFYVLAFHPFASMIVAFFGASAIWAVFLEDRVKRWRDRDNFPTRVE